VRPGAFTSFRLIGALHRLRCRPARNDPVYAASFVLTDGLGRSVPRARPRRQFSRALRQRLVLQRLTVGIFARPGRGSSGLFIAPP
jgi:hypothetical protein